ncbi:LysE family translocator [Comamonas sp. GB3 AK4-5]|uniref:LysE family translocator n=1 Tax=Comamonas sp. GB3 AK4-5 TaxID=3231487 RepID=UPI00351E4B34
MNEWIAVITITLLAVISPGPDFAMVTRNSLMLSRRAGLLTALGISLGVWVHVGYTLVGVGLLIQQSLWLFQAIKLVGAAYLIYLGLQMLRTKAGGSLATDRALPTSNAAALRCGFFTNALNPKTTVFVVSLFMQVVQPSTPLAQQIAYGAFIALAHMAWFGLLAWCFSSSTVRQRLLAMRHWIDRICGGLLISFGTLLALARR